MKVIARSSIHESTKRIQPARGWCATVGGTVGGNTANCIHLPRLSGGPATQFFWGSQPCVPAAWLAERLLLAGDIKSNPQRLPHLHFLSTSPHTHSLHSRPNTTYTSRLSHISITQNSTPTTPTPAPHTDTLPHTQHAH